MNKTAIFDTAIELLIVDDSRQKANTCATNLKNAGFAVHLSRIDNNTEQLEETLNGDFDIALFAESATGTSVEAAIALFRQKAPDLPIIILTSENSTANFAQLINTGVRDLVPADNEDHLKLAIIRELRNLNVSKQLTKAQHSLKEAENRCTSLIDSSKAAIAYVHEGMHVRANPAYLQLFGCTDMEEIEGLPILELIAPDHLPAFKKLLRSLSRDNSQSTTTEIECLRSNGETFVATLETSEASIDGEPCTQVIIHDCSIQKELEEKLYLLSNKDIHTNLYNRPYFFDKLEATIEIALNDGPAATLFYIILDNFQEIRNTSGVVVTDTILKEVGEVLEPLAGKKDILAHFGDHTFTLLTAALQPEDAEALASLICSTIGNHTFSMNAQFVSPTCSIGVTSTSPEVTSAQDMLNLAYHASETARQNGGDQFAIAAPTECEDELQESETDLSQLIDHALSHNQFRLVYQPIVSLQGDTHENYAVLVRLLDGNKEEIQPHYFLKQAEKLGRMVDIDRWVIRNAIAELSTQRKSGRKVNFFINISADALNDDGLLLWICDSLREFEAKGPWVTFQISDKNAHENIDATQKLAEGLQKIKCPLAIDHFGHAKNPEKLFKSLPIKFIKFAPDFMHDLANNQEKQDTLNAINKLAHSFDIKTVATGVEDASSLAILWTIGVNYIRGYFLQEPSHSFDYDFNHH
ncbi:MAG: EAL domain-containing protein [Candidatus Polarisedimenticolaceae bacterium]|nr:EAL domain-containing protein [Candidatus Polarisedimenticolaceae bacterium]